MQMLCACWDTDIQVDVALVDILQVFHKRSHYNVNSVTCYTLNVLNKTVISKCTFIVYIISLII